MAGDTAPLLRMDGISKHYGGVRALEDVQFECHSGRIHAVLGENGAGKSTLIKIMSGVVRPDTGDRRVRRQPRHFHQSRRGQRRRHRLHVPGAVAAARPDGGRQYLHHQSAEKRLADRRAQAKRNCRRDAGPCRRRRHSPAVAGRRPAAIAPPDGGNRQGAGAQSQTADPRRGDLGADRRRCRAGLRDSKALARRRHGDRLHLAPHARDCRAR